jgi:hypothetical protein
MKTIVATFRLRDGSIATATACFACSQSESAVQWSGDMARLRHHFNGQIIERTFAPTFPTTMRTLGGHIAARVVLEERGDWDELEAVKSVHHT